MAGNPYTDLKLSREIHAIPLWVALRWLLVVIVRGPVYADRFIRDQDRS